MPAAFDCHLVPFDPANSDSVAAAAKEVADWVAAREETHLIQDPSPVVLDGGGMALYVYGRSLDFQNAQGRISLQARVALQREAESLAGGVQAARPGPQFPNLGQ